MQKFFKIIFIAAWCIAVISWGQLAIIETKALKNEHPTPEFTQPIELKGVIRYVTPEQATTDNLARKAFFCSCCTGLLFGLANWRLEKRKKKIPETSN